MIAICDYGQGNLGSIQNMLRIIGAKCCITSNPEMINSADKIILPGVGKFDTGMKLLNERGLDGIIRKMSASGKPILGICLGMQMLGERSEEGLLPGLGLIPFKSVRFDFSSECLKRDNLKVPHMGWDIVDFVNESPLTNGIEGQQRYYFVHSYHAVCDSSTNVLMTCNYGIRFAAAVSSGNVYGVQFHPEKSHDFGMTLLKNFAEVC